MPAKMFKIFLSLSEIWKLFSVKKMQVRDEKKHLNILKVKHSHIKRIFSKEA